MLEEYVGLDKKQIAYVKRQNSRACTIFKNYPQCYLLEREIGLLNLHDDDSEDEQLAKAKRRDQLRNQGENEVEEVNVG
jgi:hypothetical protein